MLARRKLGAKPVKQTVSLRWVNGIQRPRKLTVCATRLLDRALIIGGKCEISNGSGKSPGLNQLVFGGLLRKCSQQREAARIPLETSSYFAQTVGCFKRFLREA